METIWQNITLSRLEKLELYGGIRVKTVKENGKIRIKAEQMNLRIGFRTEASILDLLQKAFRYENLPNSIRFEIKTYQPRTQFIDKKWLFNQLDKFQLSLQDLLQSLKITWEQVQNFFRNPDGFPKLRTILFKYFYFLEKSTD